MASGTINRETSMILGSFSEMPNLPGQNGFYGFVLSANVTVGNTTIYAGTRIFGVFIGTVFHGIGINTSGSYAYLVRYSGNGWTLLGKLQIVQ